MTSVDVSGADKWLASFTRRMRAGARAALATALHEAEGFAKQEPQAFKTHTGRLKRSIGFTIGASGLTGKLRADRRVAPYAGWVEYGRGPVRPVRAKFLRFVINGRVIFTKFARSAAQRPYVRPAAARAEVTMRSSLESMAFVEARGGRRG